MSRLALYVFGPPHIERDGRPVTTDTRKAIALLAYLAVTRQRHSRDALAALLWPDYDQTHARATLRRTLSTLNKALAGEWLQIDRETISLNQHRDFWLDVDEFKAHLEECRNHQHQSASSVCDACLEPLNRAAALYTGDFMAGFALQDSASFDDWQFYQADSFRRELTSVLERLAQGYGARGEFETAILSARHLLSLDPLHEPAHRYLIQLYAWAGRRAASIHQYQECVRILNEELGVAPLEATTLLYESIRTNRGLPPPTQKQDTAPTEASLTIRSTAPVSLLEQPPLVQTTPIFPSGHYPLVGRKSEWDMLIHIYKKKIPAGYVVAFDGEAGIGKTRLAEEFLVYARARGANVIAVRCYEGEMDLAYVPIAAGLRTGIKQQNDDWREQLPSHWLREATRLLPELADLDAGVVSPPLLDTTGAQSRFFEGLLQTLFALVTSKPSILFFDDMHWADEASLEFLSYLVRRIEGKPVCLLLTWRNVQRDSLQRLQRLLAEIQHHHQATLFTLSRLDQSAVQHLVQQASSIDDDSSHNLTQRLYRETEGVPLFLTEYLSAIHGGLLQPGDNNWDLPRGVRDLLISRLTLVREASRQLLGTAATIGRSFDFDTLREASGRSEEETVNGLEELINQGLVQEMRGNGTHDQGRISLPPSHGLEHELLPVYDFCHEKMRTLVYSEMTLARRRLLHRRIAEALVARLRGQREMGALIGQIAHHYLAAGRKEATNYFLQAGEYARSLYAHSEALAHFRQVLALGYPDTAYLQETIGDLHIFLGEYESALRSYQVAQALCTDPHSHAMLEHKQGKVYERRGKWELAEDHYATALRLLDQSGQAELAEKQARIYADWSLSVHHRGKLEHALELAQRAHDLAETANESPALAQVHNLLGILANSRGALETAYAHLERSLALAEHVQDTSIRVAALNNLALACKARGEIERAIALTEAALVLCISQGDRHREAALHSNLADLFHEAKRSPEAMNQLELAARIYSEIDIEAGAMQPEIWMLVEW
ncbi:AAA family ATPase [Ktedonospora formicarum]|uniref:Transcriptional activator n=1 Tax=Ktedonospora formicarum TaxID=2778364 RepID=A0A8J3I5K2_9CHLR|nr:AAA family ATPase [Ktedonospora formicarum]GHO49071.1 transcriptional activator [Ktedonospora formicarum]